MHEKELQAMHENKWIKVESNDSGHCNHSDEITLSYLSCQCIIARVVVYRSRGSYDTDGKSYMYINSSSYTLSKFNRTNI